MGDPPGKDKTSLVGRNLLVLAVAQALGLSGMSMMIFIGGIVGRELLGQGDLFGGDSSGLSSYRLVKGDAAEACLLLIKIKRNQSLFFELYQ